MEKKNLLIAAFSIIFTGGFVACEKENVESVRLENVHENSVDPEYNSVLDDINEQFPTQEDKDQELRRLMTKYSQLSEDREDCFTAAWDYGTREGEEIFEIENELAGGRLGESSLAWYEWYYMNKYYEEHCE